MKESEEQFRISIEKAPEAILLFDINQDRYIEANVEAERIFGCSHQQLLDSGPQQFYKPDQPDLLPISETVDEHRRLVITGETIVFERYIRNTRGEDLVMEVRLVLLQFTGRKLIRSSFIDITDRKHAEEALSLAIKKLNLLSGITRHDINNQLTMLMGFISILEMKNPDRSLSEYFQKVSKAAQRISSMIRFTKEYDEIGIHAPVWQKCRTVVDIAAKEVPLGQITVQNDIPDGAEVFTDQLIVKVFYNLMDNAARYGGKITTIFFSIEDRGDDNLIVCEDDGEGIPAGEKERIFERGFGKNTGLGLFLSREILDITGITISETGELGKGARLEMTVPKGIWRRTGEV